jgi:hypothetical protein
MQGCFFLVSLPLFFSKDEEVGVGGKCEDFYDNED